MKKLKRVKVLGFDHPNRWYRSFIGSVFTVRDNDRPESYIVEGMWNQYGCEYRIEKCDCEEVEEQK